MQSAELQIPVNGPLAEYQADDGKANDPVDRLMEETWAARSDKANRRELIVEAVTAGSFVAFAGALAWGSVPHVQWGLALTLIALYALVAGAVRFPIGVGYVVPSYVVLVPMLLLLPPATVPLFTAIGLLIGAAIPWAARRNTAQHVLFAIPNAWFSVGPALVLIVAGHLHGGFETTVVYLGALLAGCLVDLAVSTLRESVGLGVAPRLQMRVAVSVWLIDACIAPVGLLLALVSRHHHMTLLLVLPLGALLWILERDRRERIERAHDGLDLLNRERTRLQAAVRRLGDAFAAKLDLASLINIALCGSIEALDADAGELLLDVKGRGQLSKVEGDPELSAILERASRLATESRQHEQLEAGGVWALAVPIGRGVRGVLTGGSLAVARRGREFRDDEQALMLSLVERARIAVSEILAHEALREQALTDPLTGLGNRRQLAADLAERMAAASDGKAEPGVLMLFDLDGFKSYNDTFGHMAGDALLARLGAKLAMAVAPRGTAYRLGGDEFCVLLPAAAGDLRRAVVDAAGALRERGDKFAIDASCGAVLIPHEAPSPDYALQLADQRMYSHKHSRPLGAREQTRDVLVRIMHAKQPELPEHSSFVSRLAIAVGRRMGMSGEELDELARAAELHDIGKVGVPDAILDKPGPLDDGEWEFVHQHTILGERILNAAPALRPVATIVRASHERWDGQGYPDGLAADEIPVAARVVAVCDAYDAMTSNRCYRKARSKAAARLELMSEAGLQFDPMVVATVLVELDEPQWEHPEGADEELFSRATDELANRLLEVLEAGGSASDEAPSKYIDITSAHHEAQVVAA
jgi:diguanylate cyclase (GGDEF)-like protein